MTFAAKLARAGLALAAALVALSALPALAFPPAPAEEKTDKIAFTTVTEGGKKIQIAVMNPDGSKRTVLTKGDGIEVDPALSPDGKRVAFVEVVKDDQKGDVWVMAFDGKDRKKLTANPAKTLALGVCWSPDGKKIAYSAMTGFDKGPAPDADVMVMDADGKNAKSLGKGLMPAWSPDGKKLLYTSIDLTSPGKEPRLAVMDADGKNAKDITTTPALLGAWSPDGKKIVYVGAPDTKGSKPHLYVSKPDGSDAKQLTADNGDMGEMGARFSADGKKIFFTRMNFKGGPEKAQILVMDADGKNEKELTKEGGMDLLGGASMFIMRGGSSAPK